jgi:SAM-dependent methyltransferase
MTILRPSAIDPSLEREVKHFYREVEDYDWIPVTDHFAGAESLLHRLRERGTLSLLRRYGRGERFLDAGCGTGLLLRHLPRGSVGIDINPRHAARAGTHAPDATVLVGDIEDPLPFPPSTFDAAVCTEVLEHLSYPDRALTNIRSALKTGGVLIGSTPRRSLLWRLRFLSSTHYGNEPFHHEYRGGELRTLFGNEWRVLLLKKRCLGMLYFFVLQKP